jgi:GntR family transcriptional regulator, transcriptional repressor for pyruvate dehydrogenase complex
MKSLPIKPLPAKKRAFEQISDQIRELIYSGVFKPGDKLPSERELSLEFNVGRTALREALRVLENEGFINIRQGSNGGSYIDIPQNHAGIKTAVDLFRLGELKIQHITEARMALELLLLEFVIFRITDDELDQLEKEIDKIELSIKKKHIPISDIAHFHLFLTKSCRNPVFDMLVGSLVNLEFNIIGKIKKGEESQYIDHLNQHKMILKALKNRDLDEVKKALKKHILFVHGSYNKRVESGVAGK